MKTAVHFLPFLLALLLVGPTFAPIDRSRAPTNELPPPASLEAFDEAALVLVAGGLDLIELASTAESWTAAEVRAGHRIQLRRTKDFLRYSRGLLEGEIADRAPPHQTDPPVSDPPQVEPPAIDPTPGTPAEFFFENPPFLDGAPYGWLPDLTEDDLEGAELREFYRLGKDPAEGLLGGWNSDQIVQLPAEFSNRRIVYNSHKAPTWDEWGPKWGIRAYNSEGTIRDLVQYRVGDFTKGREGHAIYLNIAGDLLLERVEAYQCGGQFLQLVWRAKETLIAPEDFDQADHLVRVVDCVSVDNGAINYGSAVRASYPLAFYNPGQRLELIRFKVRTKLEPFQTSSGLRTSHGGVFVGPGQEYRRCASAYIEDLDVEVWGSDRSEVKLWAVDEAILLRPRIIDHGGTADVVIVDDCGVVKIIEPRTDIFVSVKSAAKPYSAPIQTHKVRAGETWTFRGNN